MRNSYDFIFVLLLFAVLSSLFFTLSLLKVKIVEPSKMFLLGWIGSISFLLFGFVEYDQVFSVSSFLSILGGIVSFTMGTLLYRTSHPKSLIFHSRDSVRSFSRYSIVAIFLGSVIYITFEFIEVMQFIREGKSFLALELLRQEHWETVLRGVTNVPQILKSIFRSTAIISAVALPIFLMKKNKLFSLISCLCFLGLVCESILQAGRTIPVFLAFAIFFLYSFLKYFPKPHRRKRNAGMKQLIKNSFSILLISTLAYMLFVVFPKYRNTNLVNNIDVFMKGQHNAKVSDWVYSYAKMPALEWLPLFAYGTSYFSLPIVKYTFFIKEGSVHEWYELGAYNLPMLSRGWSMLSGEKNYWLGLRNEIAQISKVKGYNQNPWATGLRDFAIDFGFIGSIIILFCSGILSQHLYQKSLKVRSAEQFILATLVGVGCFIFAFLSPLVLGFFVKSLLLIVVLSFFRRIVSSKANTNTVKNTRVSRVT